MDKDILHKVDSMGTHSNSEQTSVSFPDTRINLFSAKKANRFGSRINKFKPMPFHIIVKQLENCEEPSAPLYTSESKTENNASIKSSSENSIADSNNILDTTILENTDENIDLIPSDKWITETPAKKSEVINGVSDILQRKLENLKINNVNKEPYKKEVKYFPQGASSKDINLYECEKKKILSENKSESNHLIKNSVHFNIYQSPVVKNSFSSLNVPRCNTLKENSRMQIIKKSDSTYRRDDLLCTPINKHSLHARQNIQSSTKKKESSIRMETNDNIMKGHENDRPVKQNIQFSMAIQPPPTPLKFVAPETIIKSSMMKNKSFKSLTVHGKEYIVISKLGEGGSCQVFNCLEPESLQYRAIKIVNLAVDAVTANGYINEVKMLRTLQGNDHVVKLYDYENSKQTLFVVMEKGGIDLSVFLRNIATKSSRLPMYVINYYWMEMLSCVKEIHEAGIIHSDLKPSNFLIVDGRLKLIDFGIASRLSAEMTSVIKNVQVGTFNYISPEALLDSRTYSGSPGDGGPEIKISYKSDVWSLGCILYQMIYRRTPFHSIGNTWAKISAIVDPNHCIEYPQSEGVPVVCIDTIKKCLQYDIKLRPTVSELLSFYNSFIS